jgi:hypothetical protein
MKQKSRLQVFKILNATNTIGGENCDSSFVGLSKFTNQEV